MFKRLFALILAFFSSLSLVFSAEESFLIKPFQLVFGETGVITTIFSNEYILFGLYFVAMFTIFFKLVQVAVKPLFGNSRKEANTFAFAVAFMGISGIFFIYKDPTELILTFGTLTGLFLITAVFLGIMRIIHNILTDSFSIESFSLRWWFYLSLAFLVLVNLPISIVTKIIERITGTDTSLYSTFLEYLLTSQAIALLLVLVLFFIVLGLRKKVGSSDEDREIARKNPEYKELVTLINEVKKNLTSLDKSFNLLKKMLKVN
jgi:hypothetical protein